MAIGRNEHLVRNLHRDEIEKAWRDMVSTEAGRAAIWSLLQELGLYSVMPPDKLYSPFADGKRAAAIIVMGKAFIDADAHANAILEEAERNQQLAAARAADQARDDDDE